MQIGSAFPLDKPLTMEIKGRNLIEGVPKTITVDDSEIREALSEGIATIMNAIRVALERTPPELSADISDRGIVLTGGGALIKNLDKRIRQETGLPVSDRRRSAGFGGAGNRQNADGVRLLRRIADRIVVNQFLVSGFQYQLVQWGTGVLARLTPVAATIHDAAGVVKLETRN